MISHFSGVVTIKFDSSIYYLVKWTSPVAEFSILISPKSYRQANIAILVFPAPVGAQINKF